MRVYKFDMSGETTTLREVGHLGDTVFLLSYPNAQALCSASEYGSKATVSIYFMHNTMKEPDGGLPHVFNLGSQVLETLRPCQDMTELMCNPFWRLPTDPECA